MSTGDDMMEVNYLVKVNIRMAPGLEGEKDKRWGKKHNDNTTALESSHAC
jgi:hypothetical protein